ncbi:MAG: D-alanyl-D-alanine carboxypeptidase/D-alanyl-D-alanine endopeptidase [Pseudooceanicola sp.]
MKNGEGRKFLTRRGLLGGIAALAAAPALANAPARSLRPLVRPGERPPPSVPGGAELVADARLDAPVVYAVAEAGSGRMLEGLDPDRLVPPASVAKSLTALYALEVLGPEFRFETRLIATGAVRDGVLEGDLVLAGGGDPTLDTDGLADLAAQLKAAGMREVKGRFLTWDGALPRVATIDRAQPDHVGYSPAVSGLNLNFNRVHFEWTREGGKWQVTMEARTAKYRPGVEMARMRVEDRTGPVYTYESRDGRDDWTVAQGALGSGGARWLPVRKPAAYAGEVFQTLARSHGIVLKTAAPLDTPPEGDVLATWRSETLTAILRDMLEYSTNLTAECVGLASSARRLPRVTGLNTSAMAMNGWLAERFGAHRIRMVDHSGLGGDSRVTAGDMLRVLGDPASQSRLVPILKDIPVRDDKGRPLRDAPIGVRAKTGTLNFVSGLAGYVTAEQGERLAFAIFAADVPRREALSEAERERPPGARSWAGRARRLQRALIDRWGRLYATS